MSDARWIKLHCGEETLALIANHPNAFLLQTQCGIRAKWKDCPITKLKAGQAFIGDWREAGLPSEMAYRHAKKVLSDCGLVSFQGTNKGTIATLLNSTIYTISRDADNGQGSDQATAEERSRNDPTTDKERVTRQIDGSTDGQIDGESEKPSILEASQVPKRKVSKDELISTDGMLPFESDAFREAWSGWIEHLNQRPKSKRPTQAALSAQLRKVKAMGEAAAISALWHSVEKSYQGIYQDPGYQPEGGRPSDFQEVLDYAIESGVSEAVATAYFDEAERAGWKDWRRNPIENWKADFRAYSERKLKAPDSRQQRASAEYPQPKLELP